MAEVKTASKPAATKSRVSSRPRGLGTLKVDMNDFVMDGEMSVEDAEIVFKDFIQQSNVSINSDAHHDEFLDKLAVVLRSGTSAERDYEKSSFVFGGERISLSALVDAANQVYHAENAVRVWAKSYEGGELAARLANILKDPSNVEFRQIAASDYGVSIEYAHLCFDFASALVKYGYTLSQMERAIIRTNTSLKIRTSRSAFVGGTDGGSIQQMSDAVASGSHASIAATNTDQVQAAAPGFASRANFASLRH